MISKTKYLSRGGGKEKSQMKHFIQTALGLILFFIIFNLKNINRINWFFPSNSLAATYNSDNVLSELSGLDLLSNQVISVRLKEAKIATTIIFLSAVCPCSESHLPVLIELAKEFSNKGIRFVGVHSNANETIEFARDRFNPVDPNYLNKRVPILPFPIIQDDRNCSIANNLKAKNTPHVFVIDPHLNILFRGGIDNSSIAQNATRHYLRNALKAIVDGKEPPEKEVRVLGCEIKRP